MSFKKNLSKEGIQLKPSKEKAIINKHHWIFSGAIARTPVYNEGATLPVFSADGDMLGYGYFNSKTSISGRMLSFGTTPPEESIKKNIDEAIILRQSLFPSPEITNAYRLINAEGDRLPGLIVDRYADVLVLQISTLGMEQWKGFIVDYLTQTLQPLAIYENSSSPSRKEEKLPKVQQLLYGSGPSEVTIRENGLSFIVSLTDGQKTGFFLDHREMRRSIQEICKGKRILNCFGYTGAFTAYACAGGALSTKTVDISKSALELARRNLELNSFSQEQNKLIEADAFDFLREQSLDYDLIILDPPAFAKKKQDIVNACRGYKEINRQAMQKMPAGSILLTCSCSYHVDPKTFQTVIFQAAVEAGREVRIIGRHHLAPDHPINLCHPEGDYLKSLLLWVG